jgi:hypothetical protein
MKWISSRGNSRGILVGVKINFFDMGSFVDGEFMIQLNVWDKEH